MAAPVTTLFAQEELLEVPTVSPGIFNAAKVRLFSSPFAPSRLTTLAQMEAIEANYEGYAQQTVGAWFDAILDVNGQVVIMAPSLQFQPTGPDSMNTIYGVFITDNAGTNLLLVEVFDVPVPMPDENSGFDYTPKVVWGS